MTSLPLVLATRNAGKTEELRRLLANFPVVIRNLGDFGPIPPVEEDGMSFEENAVKKARGTSKVLELPALADDSGLTVDALGGAPGVRSARYAGEHASDADNNAKLLKELEHEENRAAAFVCVIAVAVPWGPALVYEGRCDGLITREQIGTEGFGYEAVRLRVLSKTPRIAARAWINQTPEQAPQKHKSTFSFETPLSSKTPVFIQV